MNIYAEILIEEARRRGIEVEIIDNHFNYFTLTYQGESVRCWESFTDRTPSMSAVVCQNKYLTLKLLREGGLKVPRQALWNNRQEASAFLASCRNKIVVKPLDGEQGKGITVGVKTEEQLRKAVDYAKKYFKDVLLEEQVEGNDLRIIVINYEFVAAIERVPPWVEGDGRSSVEKLIRQKNEELFRSTRGESRIPLNEASEDFIREQGSTLQDVLSPGKKLHVSRLSNFHSGGTIQDVTHQVSQTLREVSEKAARILTMPVVGLDFMVSTPSARDYSIIEANERPGLANHEPQPTAEKFIDFLFPNSQKGSM